MPNWKFTRDLRNMPVFKNLHPKWGINNVTQQNFNLLAYPLKGMNDTWRVNTHVYQICILLYND
jgi:hypothetical protein